MTAAVVLLKRTSVGKDKGLAEQSTQYAQIMSKGSHSTVLELSGEEKVTVCCDDKDSRLWYMPYDKMLKIARKFIVQYTHSSFLITAGARILRSLLLSFVYLRWT